MVHTFQNLEDLNLTLDLEIHQHLGSLKHVIYIIMWIRDTGCYSDGALGYWWQRLQEIIGAEAQEEEAGMAQPDKI
jgi:hypothetical protein